MSRMSDIRNKVREILESMHGTWNVWQIVIDSMKKEGESSRIEGKFSQSWGGKVNCPFTVVLDKNNNVIEARINHKYTG